MIGSVAGSTRGQSLIAAVMGYAGSILAAVAYLASNSWFGARDLPAMLVYSIPLAAAVYGVSRLLRSHRLWLRYTSALLLGPLLGLLVYFAAASLLGGWIMAFSFPVLFCWMFGGLAGLVAAAWLPHARSWPVAGFLIVLAIGLLAKASAYARAPEPRVALYLKPHATPEQVQQVWEHVIGRPSKSGEGFELLDGISGAAASGYAGDQPILTVSFWKHTNQHIRDSVIALISQSPLVERVVPVPEGDTSGVRTSVSY